MSGKMLHNKPPCKISSSIASGFKDMFNNLFINTLFLHNRGHAIRFGWCCQPQFYIFLNRGANFMVSTG